MGREEEIKLIAYNIWEEEGCPNWRDCEHWLRAEAIWEQQPKPETVAKSTNMQPKSGVKLNKKGTSTKKKSSTTSS